MDLKRRGKRLFRSAKQELKHAVSNKPSAQTTSSAYQLAYTDQDFLLRRQLRPIRLQLELLKAELIQHHAKIKSTVVIFGSARIPDPETAKKHLHAIKTQLTKNPEDKSLLKKAEIAEKIFEKSHYYEEARQLAKLISRHGRDEEGNALFIVTGGGPGIMEAANRGAHDVGAKSIGLNIVLPLEQGPNRFITPEFCFQFHYFAIRKMHFLIRAKALVMFPGGYGTLDELFEALTLVQTGKIARMPIILVGKKYWEGLINFNYMVEEGVIETEDLNLFTHVESGQEAWEVIRKFYEGTKS
jgi:uncharacterized protein (TIGR00730 family)